MNASSRVANPDQLTQPSPSRLGGAGNRPAESSVLVYVRRLILLTILLLSACGPGKPLPPSASSSSPAASSSASPAVSANALVNFSCRLPVSKLQSSGSVRGGFVGMASGAFSIDPDGVFDPGPDGRLKSVAQPYLYGSGQSFAEAGAGATYTRRYGRWLPMKIAAVSPDSSHYAYNGFVDQPSRHSRIHVVDVTSGVDRVIYDQDFYAVLDYRSEGIYLVNVGPTGEGAAGLWLLDPNSAALRQVAPPQAAAAPFGFYLIGGGAAWYGDVATGDQPPNQGIGAMDRVIRFDLKSHAVTPWFRRPGMQVQAIGFDGQDHLIVIATTALAGLEVPPGQGSVELWLVTAPSVAQEIYSTSKFSEFVGSFSAPLADDHGVWFGTSVGLFLYTPDGKFIKVSDAQGEVAGRCS